MPTPKQDKIFLDMDETLIASYYCERDSMVSQLLSRIYENPHAPCPSHFIINHDHGGSSLVTVRSWARKLVQYCHALVGEGNVYILTKNYWDFTNEVMRRSRMGIIDNNIITCEHLILDAPTFKKSNNILIDNESYRYHCEGPVNKVRFLHGLREKQYIQVYPYDALGYEPPSDAYFKDLKDRISKTLKTNRQYDNATKEEG